MRRFLTNATIILSRLASLAGSTNALHHARFAHPHELTTLTSHTLDDEALLLGRTHLGGLYRVKGTPPRRELGNLLVCAPPRSGKSILAISQLLTWPHSVVVVDIKGELYENTAGYLFRCNEHTLVSRVCGASLRAAPRPGHESAIR